MSGNSQKEQTVGLSAVTLLSSELYLCDADGHCHHDWSTIGCARGILGILIATPL